MEMLDCYAPSALAFEALQLSAHAFMTTNEETAMAMAKRLGEDDTGIDATPTAAAGLAGLADALKDDGAREALGLDGGSEIVLIGTEAGIKAPE